jgi:hypothetical protein
MMVQKKVQLLKKKWIIIINLYVLILTMNTV